jgi:hypothetical protein
MAMKAEEVSSELRLAGAQDLLQTAPLMRLAYTGGDGAPRVIPIGFWWDGTRVTVYTAPTAPKVQALRSRPHVASTIDTGSTSADARSLLIRGTGSIEIVDGVPDGYIAAARKSLDDAQGREFERLARAVYRQMARISITPRWARFYDFGRGRVPAFLSQLTTDDRTA